MSPLIGLAALTVLDADPYTQIELAEKHGYDTVGFRFLPAVAGTPSYPLHEDPSELARVEKRLADSPVDLFDVEIIRVAGDFVPESMRPLLEASQRLGAKALLVAGDDPDLSRFTDNYCAFARLSAEYDLAASLEFMPWTEVPNAKTAMAIVEQSDSPTRSVLVDTLHAGRSETTLDDLRAIPHDWIHYLQINDATVPTPTEKADLIRDAREHRLAPGEGGLDLVGMVSALPADTPISIELPNEPQRREMGTGPWLEYLLTSTRAVLGQVSH